MVRLLIVDDHALVAESVARFFEEFDGFEVVGVACTVADGVALAGKARPDVAVVDYSLPDGDGTEVAAGIAGCSPDTKLVMLTASTDQRVFAAAVDAGFTGFVTKDMATGDLVDAVRKVHRGEVHMPPSMLATLLPRARKGYQGFGSDLTSRESDVLRLLARGHAIHQIAADLTISVNTARNHVQNLLAKLDAHSQLEAVSRALHEGLIETP